MKATLTQCKSCHHRLRCFLLSRYFEGIQERERKYEPLEADSSNNFCGPRNEHECKTRNRGDYHGPSTVQRPLRACSSFAPTSSLDRMLCLVWSRLALLFALSSCSYAHNWLTRNPTPRDPVAYGNDASEDQNCESESTEIPRENVFRRGQETTPHWVWNVGIRWHRQVYS